MGIPNPFANETVKKILIEVVIFSISGMICMVGSTVYVNKYLLHNNKPAASPTPTKSPESAEAESEEKKDKKEEEPAKEAESHESKSEGGEGKGEHEKTSKSGNHFPLKSVIVNLAGDSARRYAKVTMTLDVSNSKVVDELNQAEPQIYDLLIKIMSKYQYEEINSPEGKETLKEEVKTRLNLLLHKGTIVGAYLTELIIQ